MIDRRAFLLQAGALTVLAGKHQLLWAQPVAGPSALSEAVLLGVDYYPDQTQESLWEEDARMMADTGFTNVRIAEFAWALMEPAEGKFDFAWLHRAIEILHKHGIQVMLGTPSAAPPPWLTSKYPEVLLVDDQGVTLSPGGRRFTCPTNATYRRLSLTIASQMAKAFANKPGVIGWQIDNEFILDDHPRCYCKFCRAGFQNWLKAKYETLDNLNRKWGTVFWSQTYTDFSQIPVPLPSNADPNPGLALDYDRYQSYANSSFLEEQLAMLRKTCPQHFVTTNNVGAPVDTIDLRELYKNLDFVAHDNYPTFAQILFSSNGSEMNYEAISSMIALGHDFMRSVKGKPHLIMEEQSGKAGQRFFSPQPYKGQLRLWTYQAIAHGAMGVNYFRWDTATSGAEEYWHGLLNHDRSKSPGFDEVKRTVQEIKALGLEMLHSSYPADVALCFEYDTSWATAIQPGQPKLSYVQQIISWYSAVTATRVGTDIISAGSSDLSRYKVIFAPQPYVISERQAANIKNFVQAGGIFVSGFRLGVKDEYSRIASTPLPGPLREVMGLTLKDYVPIFWEKFGVKFSSPLEGPDGKCQLWADILEPSTAKVLATYAGGPYPGEAAIAVNSYGKGQAVYIGADLDAASLARTLSSLLKIHGVTPLFEVPRGVDLTIRQAGSRQWVFLLNHTPEPQTISLRENFKDLLTGTAYAEKISLAPYDARVLQRG